MAEEVLAVTWRTRLNGARAHVMGLVPGFLVCSVIALSATYLSEHYGGPQLLYALLIGLAFHFMHSHANVKKGIDFCGRTLLRLGVALLGARITLTQVAKLGVGSAVLMVAAVALTITVGVLLAKMLKRPRDEGILSGGAVAICGASAALAVSSVLPQTPNNERFTLLTVVGVTVLSTIAMVLYPFILGLLSVAPDQAGIVLGGTIHDVAQVVAAGMILGEKAGDTATVVKLFRVMLLVPAVFIIAMMYRGHASASASGKTAPLFPSFLLAFIVLMLLSSLNVIPAPVVKGASDVSRWLLVTAIAAAGVKTSFEDLLKLGWQPVFMLVVETLFIGLLVLVVTLMAGLGV